MELLIIISFIGKPYQIEIIQSDRTIRFNDVTTLHFRANPTNFLCIDYKVEGSGLFICTHAETTERRRNYGLYLGAPKISYRNVSFFIDIFGKMNF